MATEQQDINMEELINEYIQQLTEQEQLILEIAKKSFGKFI